MLHTKKKVRLRGIMQPACCGVPLWCGRMQFGGGQNVVDRRPQSLPPADDLDDRGLLPLARVVEDVAHEVHHPRDAAGKKIPSPMNYRPKKAPSKKRSPSKVSKVRPPSVFDEIAQSIPFFFVT